MYCESILFVTGRKTKPKHICDKYNVKNLIRVRGKEGEMHLTAYFFKGLNEMRCLWHIQLD